MNLKNIKIKLRLFLFQTLPNRNRVTKYYLTKRSLMLTPDPIIQENDQINVILTLKELMIKVLQIGKNLVGSKNF